MILILNPLFEAIENIVINEMGFNTEEEFDQARTIADRIIEEIKKRLVI